MERNLDRLHFYRIFWEIFLKIACVGRWGFTGYVSQKPRKRVFLCAYAYLRGVSKPYAIDSMRL